MKTHEKSRGGRAQWGEGGEGRHIPVGSCCSATQGQAGTASFLPAPWGPCLPSTALVRRRSYARHRHPGNARVARNLPGVSATPPRQVCGLPHGTSASERIVNYDAGWQPLDKDSTQAGRQGSSLRPRVAPREWAKKGRLSQVISPYSLPWGASCPPSLTVPGRCCLGLRLPAPPPKWPAKVAHLPQGKWAAVGKNETREKSKLRETETTNWTPEGTDKQDRKSIYMCMINILRRILEIWG